MFTEDARTTQRVLVEGFSVKTSEELYGRSDNNKIVNFPSTKNMIGKFANVMITEIRTNTLYGELFRIKYESK